MSEEEICWSESFRRAYGVNALRWVGGMSLRGCLVFSADAAGFPVEGVSWDLASKDAGRIVVKVRGESL